MDSQTRHALKQDKFVQATQESVGWVGDHRSSVIRYSIGVVVVLALVITGIVVFNQRTEAAETAMGSALDIFTAPIAAPGQPAGKGVYATSADRAKAANAQFVQVTSQYGMLPVASKAHYFAGLTYQDLGQTASAETELKSAASSWDGNLSSLAKFALANLYHQSGRDGQAIELYNGLIAKPTATVPAFTSQLAEADLYAAAGKTDQAKQIWAKIKDTDKTTDKVPQPGPAGAIAAEKLTPKK